jgi:paraquat-inducible protein B
VGRAGVSGLGTLLSGGYIQIAPGESEVMRRSFVGLEEPPVTPAGTPGIRITLTAARAGSVSAGDPVLFKGYTVGRVETEKFDPERQLLSYDVFIDAPYDKKLTHRHRFWDVSGVSAKAGADGIEVNLPALETLLIGGVEVGLPTGVGPGRPIDPGEEFQLYDSFDAVNERPYRYSLQYVVRFPQSVRGLSPGAPVEYRGIRLGQVERIMLSEIATGGGRGVAIPVLIRLEPARIEMPDSPEGVERFRETIETAVGNGLRASLSTGNLLTGALFVTMDIYPNAEKDGLGEFADVQTIPTVPSGLEGIAQKVTVLLDKLNELPLDDTVARAEQLLASVDRLVASPDMQRLPQALEEAVVELRATLASLSADSELQNRLMPTITELERTLASLRQVLDTIDEQPNALIFNREYREDPRPPAGSQ